MQAAPIRAPGGAAGDVDGRTLCRASRRGECEGLRESLQRARRMEESRRRRSTASMIRLSGRF